jgi:hypothetical protein
MWYDVDDVEALRRLCAELLGADEECRRDRTYRAPHTTVFLTDLLRSGEPRLMLGPAESSGGRAGR